MNIFGSALNTYAEIVIVDTITEHSLTSVSEKKETISVTSSLIRELKVVGLHLSILRVSFLNNSKNIFLFNSSTVSCLVSICM